MFDFQNLRVYHKATAFNQQVNRLAKESRLDTITRSQLKRAALSVVLNIAEGSGRMSKPDRRNFFIVSRSSVFECVALFDLLRGDYRAFDESYDDLVFRADELSRILYAMIKNLNGSK